MTTWDDLTEAEELPIDALARATADPAALGAPADTSDDDEGGVSDPSESVTLWVDEAYAVRRVRISTRWREKDDQPLAERVLFAAKQATLGRLLLQDEQPEDDLGEPRFAGNLMDPPYAPYEFQDLVERTMQVRDRMRELDARDDVRPTTIRHEESVGQSPNLKVSVAIDHQRRPSLVDIDERWLAGARAEQVVEALTAAFDAAYARWREPVVEPGEYAELAQELDELRQRTLRPVLVACGWVDPRKEDR